MRQDARHEFHEYPSPTACTRLQRMRRHLHLLLLLLSLTLPVNAVAGLLALSQPCPMEHMSMADMQGSCCQDQAQQLANGKVCKTGQECKNNGMLQVSVIKTPCLFVRSLALTPTLDFHPSTSPSGVWRPPRV